jgi:hypothetical protein
LLFALDSIIPENSHRWALQPGLEFYHPVHAGIEPGDDYFAHGKPGGGFILSKRRTNPFTGTGGLDR